MISREIERLLSFGQQHKLIESEDKIQVRNALLDLLGVSEPYFEQIPYQAQTATELLENILNYAAENRLISPDTLTERDRFSARVMGLLMPRQSEVIRDFYTRLEQSPAKATDAFYALSRASNYIQVDRVSKSAHWTGQTDVGRLEISINLSKPEKDPREIEAEKTAPKTNYPKCLLCAENVGFPGTHSHPARQNHRIIPLTLNGEDWYFQYSPYVYYQEHCIILAARHTPMQISRDTFSRLLDFAGKFPHYFIGSNADLPIVGGSILSHDHFQGGRHTFPIQKAKPHRTYVHSKYPGVDVCTVRWPLSVIRISGEDKAELASLAEDILISWNAYSDPGAEILSHSGETPHNTITPIARTNTRGLLELDLVLRNNRTSQKHPLGIFHPHANLHHIKKENIGLIEVMGLAVLPARLLRETRQIEDLLCSGQPFSPVDFADGSQSLHKHLEWLVYLTGKYGTDNTAPAAKQIIRQEIAAVFAQVLKDAGVFKCSDAGKMQFDSCMRSFGFECL